MKWISAILIFTIVLANHQLYAQPPGIDDSIMSIKGKWKKGVAFVHAYDPALPQNKFGIVYKKIDSISVFFKQAYSVPLGAEAKWYPSITGYPLFEKAPTPYSFWSLYHLYYYNKTFKKIIPGEETGTWAYVFVNSFNWFLEDSKLDAEIEGRKKRIWLLPKVLGEWKGYPLYEAYAHSPNARAVVITKNGIMPWKPLSQAKYLQALRKRKEDELKKMVSDYDEGIVKAEKMIESLRRKRDIAPNTRDVMVAAAQKSLDKMVQSREASIKTYQAAIDKDIAVIDHYLSTHSLEAMQQQAVMNMFKDFMQYRQFEDPAHKDAASLVYIDENFFDKSLPSYEPQFMTLYWRWNNNVPGLYFKNQLEENFPVEKLKAMLPEALAIPQEILHPLSPKDSIQAGIYSIMKSYAGEPNNKTTWDRCK